MKLSNIFSHRNRALLRELVVTEFKLRYQGSALGFMWSLFRPLFLFGILLVVFGFILKVGSDIEHYPIYLLLGIVLWSFFVEATNTGLQSIVGRGDLIRKINFPKYIIVISGTISALINLGISLIVVGVFMYFSNVQLRPEALLFPLIIVEIYILALALAFFLAALYVKYRDITHMWELILQAAFYGTPILYPVSLVLEKSPELAKALLLNPMAQIVQDARYVLITPQTDTLFGLTQNWLLVLTPIAVVGVTILAAAYYFSKSSKYFAENV